ncbi:MAG TPA: DUF2933 domain-containing protein [Vicinamibacterales bacterium]|jgi:hypothetical protein|nr:DUF2933 domain-containing protein [Vicinamibacterales bacterium]
MTWQRCLIAVLFSIAVTLLWNEHESHFLGILPYLLLLACPLLHLFGHRHEQRPR